VSTVGKIINNIKIYILRKRFQQLYELSLKNSNLPEGEKIAFSDGTPYTAEELEKRALEIRDDLDDLNVQISILSSYRAIRLLGLEKLIQLHNREPIYIESIMKYMYDADVSVEREYFNDLNKDLSVDEILEECFEATAGEIENDGLHEFVFERDSKDKLKIDVTRYGENFIKAYSQFFIEDRNLPEEIREKFYCQDLSFDEYLLYAEHFDGIMVGVGIDDRTDLKNYIGARNFTELIKVDKLAMSYFQARRRHYFRNDYNFKGNEDIDDIKEKFLKARDEVLEEKKSEILCGSSNIEDKKDNEFFKKNLPELFLDENAPEDLKTQYYSEELLPGDLRRNLDWINWLEGKDEFVKARLININAFYFWLGHMQKDIPNEIIEYMAKLYESEIRAKIIDGQKINKRVLTQAFRQRNSDIFFEDLPQYLSQHFRKGDWNFEDVFALPQKQKELLNGKQIHMALIYSDKDFCKKYGGDFKSFEIYEKYAGLMNLVLNVRTDKYDNVEELIRKESIKYIKDYNREYDDRVTEEYRQTYSQYFLDVDAPEGLKDIFYKKSGEKMTFELLRRHPEYMLFLEGKSIRQIFDCGYDNFFDFCRDDDIARKLGVKYGDYLIHIHWDVANAEKDKEKVVLEEVYKHIRKENFNYQDLSEDFKLIYPEMFLSAQDLEVLSNIPAEELEQIKSEFYTRKITFDELKKYPELAEVMKKKDLSRFMIYDIEELMKYLNADKDEFVDICKEYGEILRNGILRDYYIDKAKSIDIMDDDSSRDIVDKLLYKAITENGVEHDEELPERFKARYPELFLLKEDLKLLDGKRRRKEIKKQFYKREMYLTYLKNNPDIKEMLRNKDMRAYTWSDGKFLEKFTVALDGNREKAFNLMTGKFADKLDDIIPRTENWHERVDKTIKFYEETGFIPDVVVINKLPADKIKDFALNRKIWGKIVEEMPVWNDDYIGSMLELAMVMGVFETREFKRNGEMRLQGAGEEGYKKLKKFLNYVPNLYKAPFKDEDGNPGAEYQGKGYIKIKPDCSEEILYEKLEAIAREDDALMAFVQGDIFYDAMRSIARRLDGDWEDYFEENEDGDYYCTVDRKIDKKIKMMFKTLGIKNDEVLSADEYVLIDECDRRYIGRAFDGNKFNMSEVDGKFVIGDDYSIDEEESRRNKKLFDYVKFLMAEYGLEAEATRLGANNDRSNIDLELSDEQMEHLEDMADYVSSAAMGRYSEYTNIWRLVKGAKVKYINGNIIHQLFDGLNMEYNKEFSDFILENEREVIEVDELKSKLKAIQNKVIEISKDPDYAGIEITPEVVLRAIDKIEYAGEKIGFEKGKELAEKFAFDQEYFNKAQDIWEQARKRETSSIPRVKGKDDEYSYEVLRLDDVLGIYIGNITDCCQKIGGAGHTSMLHSMIEKNGRVFVVRDKGDNIIAESWLWRNGTTICFDNVEIPNRANNQRNQDAVYEIMKKVAKELCDKDKEELSKLVQEGKIDVDKAEAIRVKKVTVGDGNNDIDEIVDNEDESIQDKECKMPIEINKAYDDDSLYTDADDQVILYQAKDYIEELEVDTLAIHRDENLEKAYTDLTRIEIKTINAIEKEVNEDYNIKFSAELSDEEKAKIQVVMGTDWFMMYSEDEEKIQVNRMYKSLSSGIRKKNVREQKEAVQMLMDKGKNISMEFENDRVHRAAKSMVRHMQKRYTMKVADEGDRIFVSEIHLDNR